jgi:hypothetical protein
MYVGGNWNPRRKPTLSENRPLYHMRNGFDRETNPRPRRWPALIWPAFQAVTDSRYVSYNTMLMVTYFVTGGLLSYILCRHAQVLKYLSNAVTHTNLKLGWERRNDKIINVSSFVTDDHLNAEAYSSIESRVILKKCLATYLSLI